MMLASCFLALQPVLLEQIDTEECEIFNRTDDAT
jgi:hypothetical protein